MATQAATNTRQALLSRLLDARAETDTLFRVIRPEAIYDRPIPERHRIIFYIGHLEAFDWNLLRGLGGLASFHKEFDHLFAFGIDPVGGGLPDDRSEDWPAVDTVRMYGSRVRQLLDDALETAALPEQGDGSFEQLLNVAIEHRLMHAETLAYMFHQMPFDRKSGEPGPRQFESDSFTHDQVTIPAGRAALGQKRAAAAFGWDNEFEAHVVEVPEFTIDRYKVTNGQFLEFMEQGGYSDRALWTDEDWAWKTTEGIHHPALWTRRGNQWSYRSMFDELPLPLNWPVYVSHAEASAFARWAGRSLPTEAQWHRASEGTPEFHERETALDAWDPAPVNASRLDRSVYGVEGLRANGWEWTSTEFGPFPGFRAFDCYPGYSANFFDGKHYVLKGGSVRTAACMLRRSFRNWFQSHYQYVYAGLRCAGTTSQEI